MPRNQRQAPDAAAEPTLPGPRETGTEQPATTPPQAAQPETMQPGATQPGATEPGAVPATAQSGAAAQPETTQPETMQPGTAAAPPELKMRRTRLSGVWAAIICFVVILILLLIFIAQNSHTVDISYMGAHGHLSLGVAMLISAVCGALLVIFAGTARILELRATARKHRRLDAKAAKAARKAAGEG